MLFLKKNPQRDFTILNLTDLHLSKDELAADHPAYRVFRYTLHELITRVHPDLITISGDISWGEGHLEAYRNFAELMQSYGIPWAPVWGNHDNEDGTAVVDEIAELFLSYPTCVFEKGDPTLGCGNYVIGIREEDKIVEALVMMDTHYGTSVTYLNRNCEMTQHGSYASLTPVQMEWYREQIKNLKTMGCSDSTMIVHIPLYGYREAFYSATEDEFRAPQKVSLEDSYHGVGWREAYKSSCFGVNREGIASPDYQDGVLDVLVRYAHTKHVIAGHEHINNFSILYQGVRVTYSTKTGMGCYWNPDLNGGTVLTVTSDGVQNLRHEYVDVSHLLTSN